MEDENNGPEEPKKSGPGPLSPVLVEYCPYCSMPYDFCDFGDKWDTGLCFKECTSRYPDIFPLELMTLDNLSFSSLTVKGKKNKSKEQPQEIYLQRSARTKRKVITSLTGLHLFGVKLDLASRLISKQFATGATVIKGSQGQSDRIDIQGDVEDALVEFLTTNFSGVTEDKIIRLPPKPK